MVCLFHRQNLCARALELGMETGKLLLSKIPTVAAMCAVEGVFAYFSYGITMLYGLGEGLLSSQYSGGSRPTVEPLFHLAET